jgi:hypothetical protein
MRRKKRREKTPAHGVQTVAADMQMRTRTMRIICVFRRQLTTIILTCGVVVDEDFFLNITEKK